MACKHFSDNIQKPKWRLTTIVDLTTKLFNVTYVYQSILTQLIIKTLNEINVQ